MAACKKSALTIRSLARRYTLIVCVCRPSATKWWELREILDHRDGEKGREFLIGWEGVDENGDEWKDSWEPTKNVRLEARREYYERKQQVQKKKGLLCGLGPRIGISRSIMYGTRARPRSLRISGVRMVADNISKSRSASNIMT